MPRHPLFLVAAVLAGAAGLSAVSCADDDTSVGSVGSSATVATDHQVDSNPGVSESSVVIPATSATDPTASDAPASTTGPTLPAEDEQFLVYFLHGTELQVAGRYDPVADPTAALEALLAGPTEAETVAGVVTLVPTGTTLRSVVIDGTTAVVDLSGTFATGGGSMSMTARVAQVTYTVTQFPGITAVRFALDGAVITTIGGEGLMVDGVGRLSFPDLVPPLLVERPFPGEAVGSPIRLSGLSTSAATTVRYEVLTVDRAIVLEGSVVETPVSGDWGTFDVVLPLLPEGESGPAALRVFEETVDGATPVVTVEVPIEL